ncbi:MAG: peptidylprolyl isomerase [Alphaproteobacteria bacterium]|nr:peptidylprolyl isomerase [Alphaproteobacteria bacterium]
MRKLALALATLLLAAPALAEEPPAVMPPPPAETQAPPAPTPPTPAGPRVVIQTTMGDITLELDPVHAPVTVKNFLRYMKETHFDGTVIYRVEPNFVIQMGSWDANVKGRPVHEPIPLEANNGLSNVRGAVAMARGDPNSATADFFISLQDNPVLDHQPTDTANTTGFAVFAHVVAGMDVVDKIAAVPLGGKGPMPGAAPLDPITILKVAPAP